MELKERYLSAKRRLFDKVYGGLNEKQREAVFTTQGPLLVLAGAGSGKTTVLVKRIAFLIQYGNAYYSNYTPYQLSEETVRRLEEAESLEVSEIEQILPEFITGQCAPWQVLAITFTNKAANEIKKRIAAAFSDEDIAKDIWSGTFHSVCMRILRMHGEAVGYVGNFTVYDTEDSKKAICAAIKELRIDEKSLSYKTAMNEISRAKDRLITPEEYEQECGNDYRLRQISRVYTVYQKRLKEANALDFDDIIMQTVFLLRDHASVREYYQRKFRYVCVDEYQDTNAAQFRLTELLGGGYRNVMVVGDDDQSIYKFRGADITNILNFDKTYPDAKVIRLEQNYRSTKPILDAANAVIAHNKTRKGKTLFTGRHDGEQLVLRQCEDQNTEAKYILDKIADGVASGKQHYRDYAILYRTNAQSNILERSFAKSGTPYRMLGGLRFNDRKEIRDVVAYLQLINNHADNERLKRIINEPKRKLGGATIEAVEMIARELGISMFEVVLRVREFAALSRSAKTLESFGELICSLTELLKTDISLEAFVKQVLERSGYRQMLIDGGEEEKERLENLDEFISAIIDYCQRTEEPTLTGFLEENALVSDVDRYDESADAVVMMTIHSAKGLEFPIVFLPGMEDGIFPGMQTILASEAEMEEERRLAYVAITRAKDQLYLTHTKSRMLYGRTSYNPISRFVSEIPEELLREESASQLQRNAFRIEEPRVYYSATAAKQTRRDDTITVNKTLIKPVGAAGGKAAFSEGDRVMHMTFGAGEIMSVKPMGADILYEITFDKVGTKKLMASFARLKKL